MAGLLREDEKQWFYRSHRVPKRGVYDEDGRQVAHLWHINRATDRTNGMLMANCREMHRLLQKAADSMQAMVENGATITPYAEITGFLTELEEAIDGGNS